MTHNRKTPQKNKKRNIFDDLAELRKDPEFGRALKQFIDDTTGRQRKRLRAADELASKSKLTKKDAEKLARRVNKAAFEYLEQQHRDSRKP